MTREELVAILDAGASVLDLIHDHFPAELADGLVVLLNAGAIPGVSDTDRAKAVQAVKTTRQVFTTPQAGELAAALRRVENKPLLRHFLLKMINHAGTEGEP